jgi:hypothetical protein
VAFPNLLSGFFEDAGVCAQAPGVRTFGEGWGFGGSPQFFIEAEECGVGESVPVLEGDVVKVGGFGSQDVFVEAVDEGFNSLGDKLRIILAV